jgi:PAS domain S-box-containing protein
VEDPPFGTGPARAAIPHIQQTLLGEALEAYEIAAFVIAEDLTIMAVNRAAVELTGYPRAELLELTAPDMTSSPARLQERYAAILSGSLSRSEGELVRKDGVVVPVEYRIHATRIADAPGYYLSLVWPL